MKKKYRNKRDIYNFLEIHSFTGICMGCFFGTKCGITVGFGNVCSSTKTMSTVYPSKNLFVHNGILTGCYCGITIGFAVGNKLAYFLGIGKKIKFSFFHDFLNFFNTVRLFKQNLVVK
ncbi:hypothetical protein CPARA_1gp058 (nucleomorph) [Cryptomonas paramecium]|uniref:Uncharacterized protein n=1 Tax=Cryptomonas paramaecium TaxID=2898 RepID=F2HHC0_9CRYP|nr:hypothetical protein CPARA_1gp058 [Cryptomonas paramecium]AEA38716.1 hypothetical protein CPARA_1gp058 [Cryptomonas paramecium]|mmetsp:Transcript_53480/g.141838  ORF Transcript_53480/g.141838 Transcript_53480/m.141838 type:complete len:118 (+) Transcript_53480:22300-22653(+)